MTRDTDVVALCGSLADDSGTRTALRSALDAAGEAGARTTLVDLRERVRQLGADLVRYAGVEAYPEVAEGAPTPVCAD